MLNIPALLRATASGLVKSNMRSKIIKEKWEAKRAMQKEIKRRYNETNINNQ